MSENKNDTLQNEMENLAATFQNEYDKATAEADEHPLIQELDEIVEEDDEEEEDTAVPAPEKKKKSRKKEKKKASAVIGSILSFLLVVVLMFVTAAISFYASSFTDFDSYIYSMKCAESADNTASRIQYYKEGLAYLEAESKAMPEAPAFYAQEIQRVHELIAVGTVETEGYAAAISYMRKSLTEEQIAAPLTAEFKEFLKVTGVFETVAAECVAKVESAGADADFAAIAATYTEDETMAAAITAILENVADALAAEQAQDIEAATAAFSAAVAGLAEYSTKSQVLDEHYVLCLAQTKGYAIALNYAKANLTEEQLAAPVFADFASFAGVSDILADLAGSIYATAKDLVGNSAEVPADFEKEIAALNAPAYMNKELNALFTNVAGGLAKINEGSYTSAVEMLSSAANSFAEYGCPSACVIESVVIATAYANGYAAALDYAKKSIKEAEYTPLTEEYTAFLAAAEVFATLDVDQYNAVSANVATFTDAESSAIDVSGVVAALDIPECLQADAQTILTTMARAIVGENAGDNKAALDYYRTVAENLAAIGSKGELVIEKIAVLISKTEDLHAAYSYVTENTDKLSENEETETLTDDFAELLNTLRGAFKADKVNIFIENAKAALATSDATTVEVSDVVAASGIDASVVDFYKAYFEPLAEAFTAEKDKNLTLASNKYKELATMLADDGIALPNALLEGIITVAFKSGDLQTAITYCTNYVDMTTLEDGEFKTLCETVQLCDAAMQAATAVFEQAYYSAYYETMVERSELMAQFDDLLTEESNKYDTAFNYYYRYISELYFYTDDADSAARQREYLEKVSELIPEQIFMYGYNMIDYSISDGDYAGAKQIADSMLAINAYDDVALSLMAKLSLVDGDVAAATEYIAKGIACENESYECERWHIIICMLNGNFADAFDSVVALYEKDLSTMNECETIVVYNALFKDGTEEQQAKLSEIISYIENDLYGAYGYTYSENTMAIVNGTKTIADIFLAEPYDLW